MVEAITIDTHIENLTVRSVGVVVIDGYNRFREILSLDKPGIIIVRTQPRLEQYIRSRSA